MHPIDPPTDTVPMFSGMTERAFTLAIANLPAPDWRSALDLFHRWRFAHRRAGEGRPPAFAAVWQKSADAIAGDLSALLARHRSHITPSAHMAQLNALRSLAITAAHRGVIQ
ncbi:hypothetical protein [Asaia sp. HN010]|uniref:hypothetical protein n=1 Tax=Asaia sp. HN010 TaxID=3081233 RepID=UPI0030164F00